MRILACGDLHVDQTWGIPGHTPTHRETGEPLALWQARRTLAWIGDVARAECVDLILCGGDVFDRPRPGPAAEAVAFEAFARWAEVAPVHVVTGNHDLNGTSVHALEPMKSLRPGRIFVHDRPGRVETGCFGMPRIDLFFLPYPNKAYIAAGTDSPEATNVQVSRALADVLMAMALEARGRSAERAQVLLAHGTLAGASYNDSQTAAGWDIQIPTDHLDAFGLAVFSHLHRRQPAPGFPAGVEATHGYVGAPDRFTFGEADEPKGVSILELCDGRWECMFVRNHDARQFVTLTPESLLTHAHVWDGRGDRIYRVQAETDPATYDQVAMAVKALRSSGVLISNQCEVIRPDRARVESIRADLGMESVVAAACASRADLAEHTDDIIARVRGLGVQP